MAIGWRKEGGYDRSGRVPPSGDEARSEEWRKLMKIQGSANEWMN